MTEHLGQYATCESSFCMHYSGFPCQYRLLNLRGFSDLSDSLNIYILADHFLMSSSSILFILQIPACRECTFRPAVTFTRPCNHFLVCRECLIPRIARLNRALEAAGDDDDEQFKPEWLLAETEIEQRRHQLLLSLFNTGELCPDGVCPECGQAVSAVWSLEVAVSGRCGGGGIERLLALPSTSAGVEVPVAVRRAGLITANVTKDLLVPLAVSRTSTVWVTSENNQGASAYNLQVTCTYPGTMN